jgi:hypothetical protein
MIRAVRGTLAVACCVALVACTGGGESGTPTAAPEPSGDAVARYGDAPPRNPDGLTYQPDVVVVDGGAGVVRSVSDDGLVWTIEAGAGGIGDVDVGEVMFLTSRAVGRVAQIERAGDDVRVTLAPVQLTEVIRDGHLKLDTPVDLGKALVTEIPDMPGALAEPDAADADVLGPNRFGMGPLTRPAGALPPPKTEAEVTVGDWETNVSIDSEGVAMQVSYKPSDNIKAGFEATLGGKSFRLVVDTVISNGVVGDPTVAFHGLEFLALNVYAGIGNKGDNQKVKIELPADVVNRGFLWGGVPMVLNIKVKAFLVMAMSGAKSTVKAAGRWLLQGPIGVNAGVVSVPKFSVAESILDSLSGVAVGASGVVVGSEFRFLLGLGVPGLVSGFYAKLRFSGGLTKGSALLTPWVDCHRADLNIEAGGGFGVSIEAKQLAAVFERVKNWPVKIELEREHMYNVVQRSQTRPEVPYCGSS